MERLAAQFRDIRSQGAFLEQAYPRNAFGAGLSAKPSVLRHDATQSQDWNSVPTNSAQEFQDRLSSQTWDRIRRSRPRPFLQPPLPHRYDMRPQQSDPLKHSPRSRFVGHPWELCPLIEGALRQPPPRERRRHEN